MEIDLSLELQKIVDIRLVTLDLELFDRTHFARPDLSILDAIDPSDWNDLLYSRQRYRLRLAIGALDEVIKFIPPSADRVPEQAIVSLEGWIYFDADASRLTKARLASRRADLAARLATSSERSSARGKLPT